MKRIQIRAGMSKSLTSTGFAAFTVIGCVTGVLIVSASTVWFAFLMYLVRNWKD